MPGVGVLDRASYCSPMKVLVIDIGGTHIKLASTDHMVPLKIVSGPEMTAEMMAKQVMEACDGWEYDAITIGFPGPVEHDRPLAEPHNLGSGWTEFPYHSTFRRPLRFINDAAMQALGGYKGGKMLFLGIGTGLGTALISDGTVVPLELAHLPYRNNRTYEEYVGLAGLERRGKKRWRASVLDVIARLRGAFVVDYVVLGGGNAKLIKTLPKDVILGANSNAIAGGIALWRGSAEGTPAYQKAAARAGGAPAKPRPVKARIAQKKELAEHKVDGTKKLRKGAKKSKR